MNDSAVMFPAPETDDPDEVVVALETATALWARGDVREALRWLRRAAETAGDAGADLRAVTLARRAADLTTELQVPPTVPPSPPAPSQASQVPSMQVSPAPPRARQALRVAVEPSGDDRNVLTARVLAEGEVVPEGAHEALLVALDPSAHLLGRRR